MYTGLEPTSSIPVRSFIKVGTYSFILPNDSSSSKLIQLDSNNSFASDKTKGPKYIPLSRRGDKPNAVAWLVKNHPELKDSQISRLVGTTKSTIEKIRNRSHWNISNIVAKHPILLKLCSQEDLEKEVLKSGGVIGNPTEDG